jgi:hypothetical protein
MHAIVGDVNNCLANRTPGVACVTTRLPKDLDICKDIEKNFTTGTGDKLRGPDLQPGHDPGGEGPVPEPEDEK